MKLIADLNQLEFAIQESRSTNTILQLRVPSIHEAIEWIKERYDVGTCDGDIWACEGDWRIQLYSK